MFDDIGGFLMNLITGLPGIVIAMVVHEYAHARVAYALGDYTPRLQGRLTLNPAAHVDPIGLLMLFIVHFGWAKPVQINPMNFSNPRRDDILVSLAGPASNLITAFIALIALVLLAKFDFPFSEGTLLVFNLIIIYNINFAIFNMLPIPPLDGSHILRNLLPYELARQYEYLERYSFIFLIIILMTPVLSYIFVPLQRFIFGIFQGIVNILL
ncbi:MAG: site-2 protease family protein [Selenomonadaceae bacterium]|nr:site-2 protease family protein [Selenomonadaceae bacterium]MBR6711608.1 site-2 protease family protein [Selenomonadaceae bacterium]